MIKTKIILSQSKNAWTQYITIPAYMANDSLYPFKKGDELIIEIIPKTGIMIITKTPKNIQVTEKGIMIEI